MKKLRTSEQKMYGPRMPPVQTRSPRLAIVDKIMYGQTRRPRVLISGFGSLSSLVRMIMKAREAPQERESTDVQRLTPWVQVTWPVLNMITTWVIV